jgi:isoleucyl-tRNA synthetase
MFIPVKEEYKDKMLAERWDKILKLRKEVTKALELARTNKLIGHSLNASVTLELPKDLEELLAPYMNEIHSIFIVSSIKSAPIDGDGIYTSEDIDGLKIKVESSSDEKCERCWMHAPTVGNYSDHPGICERCYEALKQMGEL